MNIHLREAEPEDAAAIGKVRVAAWQAAYQGFMPPEYLANLDSRINLSELSESLSRQSPDFTVSVAQQESEIVAFSILGRPRFATSPDGIELWALNVLPEYWRLGIGSQLVERVGNYATDAGFQRIELWCLEGNTPAQQTYVKLGFTQSGRARSSSQLTGHTLHELHYLKPME